VIKSALNVLDMLNGDANYTIFKLSSPEKY